MTNTTTIYTLLGKKYNINKMKNLSQLTIVELELTKTLIDQLTQVLFQKNPNIPMTKELKQIQNSSNINLIPFFGFFTAGGETARFSTILKYLIFFFEIIIIIYILLTK